MIKLGCFYCGKSNRVLKPLSPSSRNVACATCLRVRKKNKKITSRARRQEKVFGITLDEEALLLEFQGGGCICMPWTGYNGRNRSLSTDHDHTTGEVRGKLCKHCNDLLGRVKDDPEYFRRMIVYLASPPARRLFGRVVVPGHIERG